MLRGPHRPRRKQQLISFCAHQSFSIDHGRIVGQDSPDRQKITLAGADCGIET